MITSFSQIQEEREREKCELLFSNRSSRHTRKGFSFMYLFLLNKLAIINEQLFLAQYIQCVFVCVTNSNLLRASPRAPLNTSLIVFFVKKKKSGSPTVLYQKSVKITTC